VPDAGQAGSALDVRTVSPKRNRPFNIYTGGVAATPSSAPARIGRPRSERARLAVLEAAADLLIDGGLRAASIEAIAARARVSKVTIYRWWPSRGAVAVDAYFHRYRQTIRFEDTGDTAADIAAQMRELIQTFRGQAGAVMAQLIGQSQDDPDLAATLRERWLHPRREAAGAVLLRGIERGQIRADVDLAALLDLLYAPLYYRLTLGHEPLDPELADTLVGVVLDGVRPRSGSGAL
jgi:AcrR family transcriptional regulator